MARGDFERLLVVAALLVLLFVAFAIRFAHGQQQKQAYLICEGRCLEGIKLGEHARMETPMVDGQGDYSKAVVKGTVVTLNHSLERIELR